MDNLPTAVALPDIKGTIGIITPFHHVRETCRINWVAQAHCQYLGSVDLRSFAVLHNLRLYLPNIESVLMDEQTLLSNQDLWTNDDVSGFDSAPVALNQAESHLYGCLIDGVYGDHVRLDLERLPLALIATALGADDEQAASLAREAELYSNVGNNYQNNAAKPTPANDAAASGQ